MTENLVIGSGPAGVAVASALLARGRQVLMIDGGKRLEPADPALQARLAASEPAIGPITTVMSGSTRNLRHRQDRCAGSARMRRLSPGPKPSPIPPPRLPSAPALPGADCRWSGVRPLPHIRQATWPAGQSPRPILRPITARSRNFCRSRAVLRRICPAIPAPAPVSRRKPCSSGQWAAICAAVCGFCRRERRLRRGASPAVSACTAALGL